MTAFVYSDDDTLSSKSGQSKEQIASLREKYGGYFGLADVRITTDSNVRNVISFMCTLSFSHVQANALGCVPCNVLFPSDCLLVGAKAKVDFAANMQCFPQ